ncbi:MAG TPA: TetR/AcrR family transcriptional regulator [Puia sp.]|jgi:TetR/AcrR family transcriptional repressor of nem operon|nr:TetR/AcrR family transcriptional regulator [Puia sp.]
MSKAEKTKQFIVEKTAPLFNMKGYAGTSLSDMEKATGLTKGSIYGNFTNKDEVALAVFDYNLQKVSSILSAEMNKRSSIKEQLLTYVDVYSDFLRLPFPEGGCPILNTAIEADDTHPDLRKKASDAIVSWKKKIVDLIEKGVENKQLRGKVNPEQTALTIIALIEGGIMISKLTGKMNYRKVVMQSVENMIRELV